LTRVILSGATGHVGSVLAPAIESAADLELVASSSPSLGITLAEALAMTEADVAIDFTVPAAAAAACAAATAAGVSLVLGTTGLAPDVRAGVDAAARAAGVRILYAPNFAIGAVLMMRMAEQAHALLPDAHIIEMHTDTKLDAPSGTALATADRMGGDIPISSVRLPGLIAHQEVIFGGLGETLTIRQDTTSREAFVPGVLLAVRRIGGLEPGLTVGLDAVL
jgi:4-hydroxy-tetrahydrodipicolinate reductase